MRLHALILALAVIGAHAASIPDNKDIEKKLAQVVKEVLDEDKVPIDNAATQEIIEENAEIKDVENNLRKQPVDIPVKVVVEDVKPVLKSDEQKEDNEVSPSNESAEIVREQIDLKNPGPPQRMQHDTQNPETFVDSLKNVVLKNAEWKASEQYAQLQKEITTLKESFENKMSELYGSIQEHLNARPSAPTALVADNADDKKDAIQVRASVRQDSANSESSNGGTSSPGSGSGSSGSANSTNQWGSGPFGGFFQNWASSFQQNLQSLNDTVTNYWSNNTNSNSSNSNSNQCGGSGGGVFGGWGQSNPLAGFGQQPQATGQQSDEPQRPGLWQAIQQNVQSFIGGNPPPAAAQSDSPQPAQPNRPVIQAFQNVIQQAGSLFNRPGSEPQAVIVPTAQEGSNVVPAENKPDSQKQPDPQASGPIKQMIASNPVVQGIAGAVQKIQNTVLPTKSREEFKNAEPVAEATKGGFRPIRPSPNQPSPGDNHDNDSSRLEQKASLPEEQKPEEPKNPLQEPTKEKEESLADKTE